MTSTKTLSGTLETIDERPALRFERRLAHPPERVWRAISEPEELAQWFLAPVDWGPETGERFDAYGHAGEVIEVDPPRRLTWNWGGESFSFEISPAGEGCVLVFTHAFDKREEGAQHAAGWETYFARLDAHLEGGHLTVEEAHGPVRELHEAYAERFDLDAEVGRRAIEKFMPPPATLEEEGERPKLRFERHLPHPIERVWRAITDPAELENWFPVEAGTYEMVVSEEPNLLVGTWFGGALRFELRPDGDGTKLVFTHEFDGRETAARDAAGWEACFLRLVALLDGEPVGRTESLETWPHKHEMYAERFRVDPELGREALRKDPSQS